MKSLYYTHKLGDSTLRVPCKLLWEDGLGYADLVMVVDTGASVSCINRDRLHDAGYLRSQPSDRYTLTATDFVRLDEYPIKQLIVNDEIEFNSAWIDAMDGVDTSAIPDYHIEESGVLGLDFLGKIANLFIIKERNVMVLTTYTIEEVLCKLHTLPSDEFGESVQFK